jgi:hypothetical protein
MRVVGGTSSSQVNCADRSGAPPAVAVNYDQARATQIQSMRIVSKARFQANKRLEAKSSANVIGLQIANFYTIAIGIFLIQFPNQASHPGSLSFISLIASVFVQIMALIEANKDYSGSARSMYECAVEINRICRELESDPRRDWSVLRTYQERYHAAIEDHSVNHDDIDHLAAQIDPSRSKKRTVEENNLLRRWRIQYALSVYGYTIVMLTVPWVCYVALVGAGYR